MDAILDIFGAWTWIFVAAIVLGALAVGVPIAVVAVVANAERLGVWAYERIDRSQRRQRSAPALRPERESEELLGPNQVSTG